METSKIIVLSLTKRAMVEECEIRLGSNPPKNQVPGEISFLCKAGKYQVASKVGSTRIW